jgi:hypothetical protein
MTTIRPCGRALTVRAEGAVVFDYLVRRFDAEVEDINAVPDDAAFACRPIRGTDPPVASNHSWGLALDLNWREHPLGATGTFTSAQLAAIHLMTAELRFLRCGVDYQHRPDPMHWEFMGTPADMAALTKRIKALDPYPAFDGKVLRRGSRGSRVGIAQKRLGLGRSFFFDARLEQNVRAFQVQRHLPVTGVIDKVTWNRLAWRL